MPLRLPDKLPAIELLKHENIFVMDESRAHSQEIRPLKICVLNLMPLKITTETDLVRLLSNTPLQLEVYFMKLKSHTPKNTPIEHMMMFYKDFQELSKQKFDGMIVTGAPIETLEYTEVRREDIIKVPGLDIIAESQESGVSIVMARGGREFFVTGHLEYAPNTLDKEYKRDMGKRDDVDLPKNYYYNDDPMQAPLVTWRAHANLFYSNWINYYVYQETPYNIDDIK